VRNDAGYLNLIQSEGEKGKASAGWKKLLNDQRILLAERWAISNRLKIS
jgi:hypothetical protein